VRAAWVCYLERLEFWHELSLLPDKGALDGVFVQVLLRHFAEISMQQHSVLNRTPVCL
jgi:hypothetical protein